MYAKWVKKNHWEENKTKKAETRLFLYVKNSLAYIIEYVRKHRYRYTYTYVHIHMLANLIVPDFKLIFFTTEICHPAHTSKLNLPLLIFILVVIFSAHFNCPLKRSNNNNRLMKMRNERSDKKRQEREKEREWKSRAERNSIEIFPAQNKQMVWIRNQLSSRKIGSGLSPYHNYFKVICFSNSDLPPFTAIQRDMERKKPMKYSGISQLMYIHACTHTYIHTYKLKYSVVCL